MQGLALLQSDQLVYHDRLALFIFRFDILF